MMGHILKKDIKLFWPFILGLAAIQMVHAAMGYQLPIVLDSPSQVLSYNDFGVLCTYAAQLVIVLLVQQDALVGTRQDWLLRPIARRDMLLAKLVFLLLAIKLPNFLCDFVLALHHGAAPAVAFAAAIFSGLDGLVSNDLITFAVAAVTENLLQAVVCVLLIAITKAFGVAWIRPLLDGRGVNPTWVSALLREWVTILAVAAVLLVQFFKRRTFTARVLLGVGLLLLAGSTVLPWDTAFAFENMLYNDRTAGGDISIGYDGPRRLLEKDAYQIRNPFLYLPLHIANLPAHSILHVANFELQILDSQNHPIFRANPTSTISLVENPDEGFLNLVQMQMGVQNSTDHPITVDAFHSFQIPREFYQRWKKRPVHFQLRYSFALLRPSGTVKIAAVDGREKLPGYGQCATGWTYDNRIGLWCFAGPNTPSCISVAIETNAGTRDPEEINCAPSYAPSWRKLSALTAPSIQIASYGFRDFGPTASLFPVKQESASDSQLVLTAFRPATYFFNRDYRTPDILLTNLMPQLASNRASPGERHNP